MVPFPFWDGVAFLSPSPLVGGAALDLPTFPSFFGLVFLSLSSFWVGAAFLLLLWSGAPPALLSPNPSLVWWRFFPSSFGWSALLLLWLAVPPCSRLGGCVCPASSFWVVLPSLLHPLGRLQLNDIFFNSAARVGPRQRRMRGGTTTQRRMRGISAAQKEREGGGTTNQRREEERAPPREGRGRHFPRGGRERAAPVQRWVVLRFESPLG